MKKRVILRRGASIAFLDVIACGFGAIVLLVLILPVGENQERQTSDVFSVISTLQNRISEAGTLSQALKFKIISGNSSLAVLQSAALKDGEQNEVVLQTEAELYERLSFLKTEADLLEQSLAREAVDSVIETKKLPSYLYGIPVDSDYLAIVIDTSGSMQTIWPKVVQKVSEVIRNYPGLLGFQILSDQGQFLYESNESWLVAEDRRIDAAIGKLSSWKPYSNSSPVEGIKIGVEKLYRPGMELALFVVGDDYTGVDFDGFLSEIDRVTDQAGNTSKLRIHSLGFFNDIHSQHPERFVQLMQVLTFNHGGSFLYFGNDVPEEANIARGGRVVSNVD
ncbi:hypothetical protein PQY67_04765 [Pseudomonadales bacterium]|jgi:hypothetical protein|nr:hypothetical protein [Pseudomonadales bacterium]